MTITRDEAARVAQLSRLALTEEELQQYTEQLDQILRYAEKLNALDTSQVEPMISAATQGNVFRSDKIRSGLQREVIFNSAPEHDDEFFRVPPIIE